MMKPALSPSDSMFVLGEAKTDGSFKLGYSPALDGIRGVAILVVMAFNARLSFVQGGYLGVDIFFVLSGFLITSLLIQEHHRTSKINLKNFYYRRALRLLPALFALMLFILVYAAILQPKEKVIITCKHILYTLFYVANWAQTGYKSTGIGVLSHAWSLSVEEQFYILWPLFLIVLLRSGLKRKGIIALLLFFISVSIAWGAWLWYEGTHYLRIYLGSDTRAHELLIGCLTALLIHWGTIGQTKGTRNAFRLLSVISIAAIFYAILNVPVSSGFLYNGGFALIAVGTAAIIINILLFPSGLWRVFEFPPLVWIGKVSYGLYLWHFPVFEAAKQMLQGRLNSFIYEVLQFGTVFVVAATSYYVLEKPFLKLKQHFSPSGELGTFASSTLKKS
jgi:peptidoglycan/LPS O-acetylase OafA/YrhL